MATKAKNEEPKKSRADKILAKRIDVAKGDKLGRDVRAPKWLRGIGAYFKGSWQELKAVRWPTRRATLSLTSAVILFTVVLAVFILGLDYGFETLFKQVIL